MVYDRIKNRNRSKRAFCDCISIASFRDNCILNKDGSLAIGFAIDLFEEETLREDDFVRINHAFSAACHRLPTGTILQRLDIYFENQKFIPNDFNYPFFHQKTLAHHSGKKILYHQSYLFLRFFNLVTNPTNTFLSLGSRIFNTPFQNLESNKQIAERSCKEFLINMPSGIVFRRLLDKDNISLLYQYASLTFNREPIGFERSMVILPDRIAMGVFLKSVAMKRQAEEVEYSRKNNFGHAGVTSDFIWPLTHYARFPHMVCQTIEIINDKEFRKEKRLEMDFSAQLKLQYRERALAMDVAEQLEQLEKKLNQQDIQIVKHSLHVLTWHASEIMLQEHTDYIKNAFSKIGIHAAEEGEDTDSSFFGHIPGGGGFLEGLYMPLETALAHSNYITPRKGDLEGIILQDRHLTPIFYDPFKYTLDNQHCFVFGPSGSGKSFFNGKMIKDRYYAGHTIVVIDSGGTYRLLFQALGGKYIEYNPESPLRLNPFLIHKKDGKYVPDPDKIAFLTNFLAKIWKGDLKKNPLGEAEYALLSKFLTTYYSSLQDDHTIPSLIGFCNWLKTYQEYIPSNIFDTDNFFVVLEPFITGIYKNNFNAIEVEHLQEYRLLCFELEAVKNDRKLYPLVVQVLFDYVFGLVACQPDQKKFIDIEEGWTMLDDASEQYIEAFFRKGRKTNTSIRIITQNISEIRDSKIAGALRNNASTFILLYNDKASVREEISEFLGMNAFDMEKYASLRRVDNYLNGYREVFIKEMDKSAVWAISCSLFEHAILTSRPDERNKVQRLISEQKSIEDGVALWVNKILTL